MSYKITEPLMWHAPADLPSGHRLVLLALAQRCTHPDTRIVRVPHADLAQLTGLSVGRVRNVLHDLAERGIEVRLPLGKSRIDGEPVYAVPGVWPRFRVPEFEPPAGCRCRECAPATGARTRAPVDRGT